MQSKTRNPKTTIKRDLKNPSLTDEIKFKPQEIRLLTLIKLN